MFYTFLRGDGRELGPFAFLREAISAAVEHNIPAQVTEQVGDERVVRGFWNNLGGYRAVQS